MTQIEKIKYQIAVLGSEDAVKLIENIINENYEMIRVIPVCIDKVKELKDKLGEISQDIDGIFATGIGVYYEVLKYDINIPIRFAKHGPIALTKCLTAIENDHQGDVKLSFDIMDSEIIEDVIKEFNFQVTDYYVEDISAEKNEDYYITKHLKLLYEEKIDYIVTSFGYIYSLFTALDLPAYRVYPSIIDIKHNIDDLLNMIQIEHSDYSQILVRIFELKNSREIGSYKNQFEDFARALTAFVYYPSDSKIVLISNRQMTTTQNAIEIAYEFIEQYHLAPCEVGIGASNSITDALEYAKIALEKSSSTTPVVYYDGLIKNHLDLNSKQNSKNLLTPKQIEEISEQTQIIQPHIQTLDLAIQSSNKSVFSSNELANILGLSVRSANRIINALISGQYASTVEKDTLKSVGRPKRLIQIDFHKDD